MTNYQENHIGGSHPGTQTIADLQAKQASRNLAFQPGVVGRAREVSERVERSLSFLTDPGGSPNYAINPDVSYLGDGSFSIIGSVGTFIFGDQTPEPKPGHFELDKQASTMTSTAGETTLGSRDIKTLEGKETNFLDTIFPSTNFTPIKTWIQNIWPFSTGQLIKLTILELIQAALLKSLDELIEDNLEGDSRKVVRERSDLVLEIQDNQEIEQEILNSLL